MKKSTPILLWLLLAGIALTGQNPLTIGTPETDTMFLNSGESFLLIPDVDDGDPGTDQEITFTVTSSDPGMVEVTGVTFEPGQTMAVVGLKEHGVPGMVTLQVEAADPDGSVNISCDVHVVPYSNPGINFEIHDVVFWQQAVPLNANPAFSMIAPDGRAPYDSIDLASLQLSVYADCQESPPCTGTDFFTAVFKGYLIPPATGEYSLYMVSGDQCSIGLSSDESFDHAEVILFSPADGRIGTVSGNKEYKSVPVNLEAGKTYAIYGTHWNVHTLIGGMMWEGPGIDKEYIPGQYLAHVYDVQKPTAPENFRLVTTGIDDLLVDWSEASDDRQLAGYRLYLNGRPSQSGLIAAQESLVDGLEPGTRYCLLVTSLDLAGNESDAGPVLCTTTYTEDLVAPTPPDLVEAPLVSDLAMKLTWSGATDGETEIRGYRLYLDGALYNPDELIYGEEWTVTGLLPETTYMISVEAVDAGLNVSEKSEEVSFSTLAFDPDDTSLSDKKARVSVLMDPVGRSDGLAVNPDYLHGEFMEDTELVRSIRELQVAGLRWGALTANPLNFSDFVGPDKVMTIGRFMNFCNELGAYTIFTCGVADGTDWRTEPQTFARFLEYLAGPADSEYGAKRAAEGFEGSLLEESRGLVFEFGNEVWGGAAHDAQIGSDYAAYGAWCREMATVMKSSPYYDPEKMFLVYSGRRPVPSDSYGLHESLLAGDQGEVDWLSLSGYLGGNLNYAPDIDPGESELDYYKNGIAEMARNLNGFEQTMRLILEYTGTFKPTYLYEANMTDETYFGRLGQAIVQTDYYASAIERGSAIPTIFHLTGGQWKMINTAQGYKKTPLYYTAQYYNRFCTGTALRTAVESKARIYNASGGAVGLDPVGAHVYASEGAFTVLLVSRDFENDYTVQVDLPDELQLISPGSAWRYEISGNEFSDREAWVDSTQVTMSDSLLVTVPRHSMVLLVFGGEGITFDPLPLGYYDYVSAESVEIYAYNTDVFDIEGREKKILLKNVTPEDVFSDAVVWTVETNGVNVNYGLKSYGFEVMGSGTCDGNGTITVRATAWDNPEVYDEVTMVITGQGTDCSTGMDVQDGTAFRLYPNPAGSHIVLEGLPSGTDRVAVTEMTGKTVISTRFPDTGRELDISGLPPGIYMINAIGSDRVYTASFVKE
ncbi:MAG: fibronectin type III domain-containing protein [Bacteroidales bacterium]